MLQVYLTCGMSAVKDLTPKGKNIVLSANMKRVEFGNSSHNGHRNSPGLDTIAKRKKMFCTVYHKYALMANKGGQVLLWFFLSDDESHSHCLYCQPAKNKEKVPLERISCKINNESKDRLEKLFTWNLSNFHFKLCCL